MNRSLLTRAPARLMVDNTPEKAAFMSELTATTLHERYLETIFGYVARRIGSHQEAEDITADVFAAAFANLKQFRGDSPQAWLLGIARRKMADALRRQSRREKLETELTSANAETNMFLERWGEKAASPELILRRQEAQRHIRALVSALRPEQREALLLQYVEELSIAEIATVMQRSPHAVNSLLQRARANIFRNGRDYFLPECSLEEVSDASDETTLRNRPRRMQP